MKKLLLINLFIFIVAVGNAALVTVTNSGNSFTPNFITITVGDSVDFTPIASNHDAREVSQATWNVNGSTMLPGGFQTPFGGGLVLPAQLTVGTHYYVCTPHAGFGMKGRIVVQNSTGISNINSPDLYIKTFPNPFSESMTIDAPNTDMMTIHNMLGERVAVVVIKNSGIPFEYTSAGLQKGVYFLKFMKKGEIILTRKVVKI